MYKRWFLRRTALCASIFCLGLGLVVSHADVAVGQGTTDIHPTFSSVSFAASSGSYTVTITGSDFGSAPEALPATGDTTVFRIEDNAQLGDAEWGYAGNDHVLTYVSWTNTRIHVSGLGASPGDSVVIAVWNTKSGIAGSWGGLIPGGSGKPVITSVTLQEVGGSLQHTDIIVNGSGFGAAPVAMPFTGNLNNFYFWVARTYCDTTSAQFTAGGAYFGDQPADAVTLNYTSWKDNKIVISGFSGAYGSGCDTFATGDAVGVAVWNSADADATGPQAAWGVSMRPSNAIFTTTFAPQGGSMQVTVDGSGFDQAPVHLPYKGDLPEFVLKDQSQLGHGEYGYTGDSSQLTYQTWYTHQPASISRVQASGVNATPGDAVIIGVLQAGSGVVATWGGNVNPVPAGTPTITQVSFTSYGPGLTITIRGRGFGSAPVAMPFSGDIDNFSFWDARSPCSGFGLFSAGGSYFGQQPADGVALNYQSWTDSQIVISGFGSGYRTGCATVRPTDPVTVTVWSSTASSDSGPQTAWGGRIPKTAIPNPGP